MPLVGVEVITKKPERCNEIELQDSPMPILINLLSGNLEVKHNKRTTQMMREAPVAYTGHVLILNNDEDDARRKEDGQPPETEVQYIYLHKGILVKFKHVKDLKDLEAESQD